MLAATRIMDTILPYTLLILSLQSSSAQYDDRPAPRYSAHKLPQTKFTCEGKFTGRYYADPDTDCQMFHICAKTSRRDISDFKFLCPNGTVFDQEHQVCADYFQVVCHFDLGSNPFEIFKLSSKESTHRREFGSVPNRDPEYLGQNSLGNDDFQVEEYNNNKLASSRNSLPFQSSQIKGKNDMFFASTSVPEPIRFTKEVIITTPIHATPTIISSRKVLGNVPILPRLSTAPPHQFTPTTTINTHFRNKAVQTTASPTTEYNDLRTTQDRKTTKHAFTPPPTSGSPKRLEVAQEKAFKPRASSIFDEPQLRFNDFASLSKFQAQFHGSIRHSTTDHPTTTTEQFITTTFVPYTDVTELDNLAFSQQFDTTVTTQATPFPNAERLVDSKARSGDRSFITESSHRSTLNLDFNTRPRSETNPPSEFRTTRRLPIYHNTFRTTYQDVTTPGPQTFRQQPTRFNDEFFSKIDNGKSDFLKNDDEDDYYPKVMSNTRSDDRHLNSTTSSYGTSSTLEVTAKPQRRRRPNKAYNQRNQFPDPKLTYSRRFHNSRYENKSAGIERSAADEIFNVEASINSGSAGINGLQNKKLDEIQSALTTSTAAPNSRRRESYVRRVRPSKGEAHNDDQDIEKALKRIKGKKESRERVASSTTEENGGAYVSATTYRPSNRGVPFFQPSRISTSTVAASEPELVTASPGQIEQLRSRDKSQKSNGTNKSVLQQPKLVNLKVTAKSFFKAAPSPSRPPKAVSSDDPESGTRSPDYDYTYFDTDSGRQLDDYVEKQDFGRKYTQA